MKPWNHARGSARRHGGTPEDYLPVHDFIDSTKIAMPDMRHRAVLHNAFGCFLAERVFGPTVTNSEGKRIPTRDLAEEHVMEDLGFIPSLEDFLDALPQAVWHGGIHRLPKEQRPPLPAQERAATRERVRDALATATLTELRDNEIDRIIAAVRGIEKDE